jgi:hypothetical protein
MSDGPDWFAPKRYGYGSGPPISWQGWALTLAFVVYACVVSVAFADRPVIIFALIAPALVVFLTVVARTTRGGWRWRWGEEE